MQFVLRTLAAAGLLACCTIATAGTVLAQTPQGGYTSNVLDGVAWGDFSARMHAKHAVSRAPDFSNLAELLAYDAVWVDQELGDALAPAEVSALQSYIAAGHKAVLIGENDSWAGWNASLMAVVGGVHANGCDWSFGAPLLANALTAGVGSVQNVCGSWLFPSSGAQVLFGNGMAALYQIGAGQALVIMDSNWNDDLYRSSVDNTKFAQNVVDWLAPVPEPETYALLLGGLGLLAWRARRRS